MLHGQVQMAVMHILGNVVDGGDARHPAVPPNAENRSELIAPGRRHGMAHISLHGADQPSLHAIGFGQFVQYLGFRNPILRCAGAVGLNVGAASQPRLSKDAARDAHGLAHGQIVADAGAGDGLLVAVRVDEHIGHGAQHLGADLKGQLIIHQQGVNGGFAHREAAVAGERAAGAAMIRRVAAV